MPQSVTLSFERLETLVALDGAASEASPAMKKSEINQPTFVQAPQVFAAFRAAPGSTVGRAAGKRWKLTKEGKRERPAVLARNRVLSVCRMDSLRGNESSDGVVTRPRISASRTGLHPSR
jgi:hypothetical protein